MTRPEIRGPLYIDSSALAKLYLPEQDSERVDDLLRGRRDLFVSDLAVTEIISAAARKRREGALSRVQLLRLYHAILEDLESNAFQRIDLLPAVHREAERRLISSDTISLRAADALHVTLALAANCMALLTYDARLAEAARAAGLMPLQ